jgi:hypothetical protein
VWGKELEKTGKVAGLTTMEERRKELGKEEPRAGVSSENISDQERS